MPLTCYIPVLLRGQLGRLVEWRVTNPDRWPSKSSTDTAEKQLGEWRTTQRTGMKAMDKGKTGAALKGMTTERASQLDAACPGWSDDKWDVQVSIYS